MFELEDYTTGSLLDGYINKYAESSSEPTLDFYISDSLQDMLDVDIRTEIANVVNAGSGIDSDCEYATTCVEGLQSSFDQATDGSILKAAYSSGTITNNNNYNAKETLYNNNMYLTTPTPTNYDTTTSTNSSSFWFGSSNDFFADVGACVNPISVMPLISSSLSQNNCLMNGTVTKPPPSPNVNDIKSHLTFSPAQIKVSANSIRNEKLTSHIPKQKTVAPSPTLVPLTTAPASLTTNSVTQRKVMVSPAVSSSSTTITAIEAVKKDLNYEMRKLTGAVSKLENNKYNNNSFTYAKSNALSPVTLSKCSGSTIKLGSGIGSLTFAHNMTFSKIKHQTAVCVKSPLGSPSIAMTNRNKCVLLNNENSPAQNNNNNNNNKGLNGTKILPRRTISPAFEYAPRSTLHTTIQHAQHSQRTISSGDMIETDTGISSKLMAECVRQDFNRLSNNGENNKVGSSTLNATPDGLSFNSGTAMKSLQQKMKPSKIEPEYPKPAYSYSCLIAMALKNSRRGSLPVSEIYSFMCEHFPYFKTAPSGWKNSVRHNLSLNKCFEKIEKPPTNGYQRKGCLWAMNPERITKMDEEVQKWSRKDPMAIRNAMVHPEHLEALERGEMKHGSTGDSDIEADSQSEIEDTSDVEEPDLDETLVEQPMLVEDEFGIDHDNDDDINNEDGNTSILIRDFSPIIKNDDGVLLKNENETNQHNQDASKDKLKFISKNNLHRVGSNVTSTLPITTTVTTTAANNFDNEVKDIYDAFDVEDDKNAVHMAINGTDIIELNPADYDGIAATHESQSPKRVRLNIDYTSNVENELEKTFKKQRPQQLHISNIKKMIKVQNVNELQQRQQQHIMTQTKATTSDVTDSITSLNTQQKHPKYTSIIGLRNVMNRRKMYINDRIV